ncbi:E3 ubiquitin-protein ligase DCST1 isoform 2-T2 [Anomaloglossus baeobatrachus]|uniref:E3 ubiquitin-protein ligase DCST1 isoform X2 n=1 Tax=Anomaloglossus baeobatrachus TaxID=238106 RepID=UPI003F4FFF47
MSSEDIKEENNPRRREKRPNTSLKRFCAFALPDPCFRFMFSSDEQFKVSKFFLGATAGSILGIGSFALGWATSTYFRCSTLVLLPNLLGKEGRTYVIITVMASIYAGPVMNLQQNIEEIARSVSCTVDQQINHTKMMWKEMTKPMKTIFQNLLETSKELKNRSSNILSMFKDVEKEIVSTEGYNKETEAPVEKKKKWMSTQKLIELKTMLRCEHVVEEGINKCKDWFAQKHEECMRVIWLPVLNHLLCLPMKFTFFCNVMHLINRWCKKRLPLEGNFGQAFDLINETVYNLGKNYTSAIVMRKEERHMLAGVNISDLSMTEDVVETLRKKQVWVLRKLPFINTIMSFMFIFLFTSAFNYTINYNKNILYDNHYVTTYFRQIDARRRKLKKKYLLPLKKVEKKDFVFPFNPCVQKLEINTMMKEIMQCLPYFILFILSNCLDRLLIHIFRTLNKHFNVPHVFVVDHKLEIVVEGESMISRLLRGAVKAFNVSASTAKLNQNNTCLPIPVIMSFKNYVYSTMPVMGLLLLCFLQVYGYRLRRVIASFFFPKREKRRILFLYNRSIRKRRLYFYKLRSKVMKRSKSQRKWEKSFLGKIRKSLPGSRFLFPQRCIVCKTRRNKDFHECSNQGCGSVYCKECWMNMDKSCWACVTDDQYVLDTIFEDLYDLT